MNEDKTPRREKKQKRIDMSWKEQKALIEAYIESNDIVRDHPPFPKGVSGQKMKGKTDVD